MLCGLEGSVGFLMCLHDFIACLDIFEWFGWLGDVCRFLMHLYDSFGEVFGCVEFWDVYLIL